MRARSVLVLLTAAAVAACSGDGGGDGASPATTTSAGAATSTSSAPPSSVALAEPKLPAIQSMAKVGGVAIKASREADWVLVAHGRAWISGLGKGLGVYDARTGRPLGSVTVPQGPCAATDEGFGAVWTATCEPGGVARIDPAKARVTGHVALSVTPEGESSIGVGEGAVWSIIDGSDCRRCAVARIDPETLKVTNRYPVPGGAAAVRAGLGGVWLTNYQTDSVVRLDPSTGKTVATIPVASGPRFFDVGAGAVWVMAQSAGALCRIDPADNRVVGCTVIDPAGVQGGDLTVGNGFIWFRGTEALVAQVDPKSGRVVRRIGPGEGSGSAAAGSGQLWISAHDVAKLYRVPVP
jgi:virginiamycin B lyase